MKILDRYIARNVLASSALALFVLTAIAVFFSFIGQLGDLNERYTVGNALAYVLLTLPRRAYELLPTSVLLGSLMGLGALAASSELVVIRSAGVSIARISLSVIKTGVLIALFTLILGEVIAPPGEQYAQSMKSTAMTGAITLRSRHGFWARDGRTYVNIRRVLPGANLEKISIYTYDKQQRLVSAMYAPRAEYHKGRWLLRDIRQTLIGAQGTKTIIKKNVYWESLLNPDLLDVLGVKPQNLSVWSLFQYINYLEQNNLDTRRYALAFWVKLATPFSTLVMLLISVPFVFGSLRNTGTGQRLLVGALVGMGYHLANQAVNHTGLVYGLPAMLSAALPVVVVAFIAMWSIRRVERT
jgi:lipopolysaccharide export system permease protein